MSGQIAANNPMVCTLPTAVRILYDHMEDDQFRGIIWGVLAFCGLGSWNPRLVLLAVSYFDVGDSFFAAPLSYPR